MTLLFWASLPYALLRLPQVQRQRREEAKQLVQMDSESALALRR